MSTKKQWKYFSIMDHEKEEEYLRSMHQSGWKFTHVSGLGIYHFESCESEDMVYQLDYNQEGLSHKEEYVKLFSDCGWEYLQDYCGYSYFRKSAKEMPHGKEEIFCDDASRLQMMERVFKGRLLPLLILFFCILLPQFFLNIFVYHNYIVATLFACILLAYVLVFTVYGIKYFRYKQNIQK
jgi:hypothetical protein